MLEGSWPQPPELVIFDCDGVLVDSEPAANRVLAEVLTELGLPTTPEQSRVRYVGRTMESVAALVSEQLGRPLPPDWEDQVRRRESAVWQKELTAVPGAREVLEHLKRRSVRFCVASSGRHEKMHLTLGLTGLLPLVEGVLFSARDVPRSKPHPDVFLLAAERMKAAPESCVVIEDSVPGVQGAKAAGMHVLGYVGDPHTDAEGLRRAGAVLFADMADVPRLLGL